jgi:hypothetical protein
LLSQNSLAGYQFSKISLAALRVPEDLCRELFQSAGAATGQTESESIALRSDSGLGWRLECEIAAALMGLNACSRSKTILWAWACGLLQAFRPSSLTPPHSETENRALESINARRRKWRFLAASFVFLRSQL